MRHQVNLLRVLSREYPRSQLLGAVEASLVELFPDEERRSIAALVAAWLVVHEPESAPPPPLGEEAIVAIQRGLHRSSN